MATVTKRVCDECGKEGRRLIELDQRLYCSRNCFLSVCKRRFDGLWMQQLQTTQSPLPVKLRKVFEVA